MSSPMPSPIDACACPLCGQPNLCAMEIAKTSGGPVGTCWCVNASFSAELLARIPPAAERKACICQACATKAKHA